MRSLKEEVLELLEKDREFRYAVAGYLGLSEVMKKLDVLAEEQTKIWREIEGLRIDFNKMLTVMRSMDIRLSRVERTLEKLILDIEEEARSILAYRVKRE